MWESEKYNPKLSMLHSILMQIISQVTHWPHHTLHETRLSPYRRSAQNLVCRRPLVTLGKVARLFHLEGWRPLVHWRPRASVWAAVSNFWLQRIAGCIRGVQCVSASSAWWFFEEVTMQSNSYCTILWKISQVRLQVAYNMQCIYWSHFWKLFPSLI